MKVKTETEIIEWIKEILDGHYKDKELTEFQALFLIHDAVYPATITQEDIDWAKGNVK